ncbi:uncharacterized protein LOC111452327 [Cucurbita moschata]|uniref:Uncharacterized protein LOC111452327 n=1 Tax=Cucurbita moschata TaxID=3662 RepID=A0A6J1GA40_CUCMO|nr:uncharacterized protein LOC111452327 [Cucurbita moschata]XP_022948751.1 uncharacterized protein LOC111452327 [Cucurbita moschata]XP_022948752.1 uncharacterized protein LOC111452327 [Cucurbita moschata]XP_022948753.1 uncharacterized protein LOC111452327 [Cucurbita moschata]
MPGNEVGDRVHNFFGQENLYQGQHQSQAADGSCAGLNNNLWVRNQREINSPFVSNLKNYNAHQPDSGGLGQPSHSLHGLNFSQSYITPEIGRSESQNQYQSLNGYAAGQQLFHARQVEANFLGADAVSDRHITSRGLSIHEAQVNNPELSKKNVARLETTDSPVNFDFFGGQQQLSGRNASVTQILPKQQPGNHDMQLLQQQAMLSHIQELQRQHQFQQQEARQHGSMNQISSNSKPTAGNHSATLIDGIPVNDLSTSPWLTEHMVNNTNSLQHSLSATMQGSSSGFVFPSEQQQALRSMGLIPEQVDHSLYGVPISTAPSFLGSNSLIPTDKPAMQQLSVSNDPISGNHYTAYPDQVSMQDGMVVRQDFIGKSMFGMSASQGLNGGLNSENLQHVNLQQRNTSMQEFGSRQDFNGRSEVSQEKTMAQVAPPQTVATLDPAEEKILYGSDDNLWDAFGRNDNITAGGFNMADGMDFNAGYSFLQSGSWSALMQSAVAETSSGDMGAQEGWGGLNCNNSGAPNGNQQSSDVNGSGKLQPVWVDNNLQTMNSRHSSVSSAANNRPNNYTNSANAFGFSQPAHKPFFQQTEGFQNSRAQSLTPSLDGERKWIDRNLQHKSLAEGHNLSENEGNTSSVEINADNMSGSWLRQQNVSSYNSQPCKPNGWSYIEPMFSHGGNSMKNHKTHNMSQSSQGGDHKRTLCEEMGSATFKQNHDSIPNATDELQHANPAVENSQVYNEGAHMINNAAVTNASSLRDDLGSRQHNPINRNVSFWKDATTSMELKESGFVEKYQHHHDKGSQMFESPGNSCLEKGATEMHEIENSNTSDTHTSSGSKQKVGGNTIRKPSLTSRRFQYHPMGNLDMDMEPSFGTSHATQPQAPMQQNSHGFKGSELSHFRQSKSGTDGNSMEVEKSDMGAFGDIPSKRMLPPFGSRFSSSLDNLTGHDPRQVALPSSQNMLELLHKVDQPREHGNATHSPSYRNPSSEMVEAETSDGSVGQAPRKQSSDSQVFGLQLGPPQRTSMQDSALSSHCSSPMVMSSTHSTSETGERGHMLASVASKQRDLRNNITGPSGHSGNKIPHINAQGNLAAASQSAFPYPRSHLHNQHLVANHSASVFSDKIGVHSRTFDVSSERVEKSQMASTDISRSGLQMNLVSSADTSHLSSGDISNAQNSSQLAQELVSVPMSRQDSFSKVSPNEWASVRTQKHSLHAEPSIAASDLLKSHMRMDNPDKNFSGQKKTDNQEKLELEGIFPVENSMNMQNIIGGEKQMQESPDQQVSGGKSEISLQATSASGGLESAGHPSLGASPSNSMATRANIDTFGHSLRPNISPQHHYSLLHHMHAIKSADNDPTNRSGKRFKGPDCGLDSQQVAMDGGQLLLHGHGNAVRESLHNNGSISHVDTAAVNYSSKKGDAYVSSNIDIASCVRGEHPQISPQMAPSWFDQYGTFNNGQSLTVFPGSKNASIKPLDQPFIVEKPPDGFNAQIPLNQANASVDGSEHNNSRDSLTPASIEHRHLSSGQSLPLDFINQSLSAVRPKKRKHSAPELLPWNEEITQSFRRLQDISMADVDWAHTTNRLIDKKEDEVEMIDDGLIIKLKRRLNLTTQLVQQLLRPPPFTTLSSDPSLHYESVAYFVARLALGDACNIVSSTGTDNASHPERNLPSERPKASGKAGYHKFIEGLENFMSRAQKMQDDLLRVEKRASILDLRVECQDLEKFSVINRFAKFHSRGQVDGGEASSSSDVTTSSQRSCPQRYVTALPIPRNLPDRVQCLSL